MFKIVIRACILAQGMVHIPYASSCTGGGGLGVNPSSNSVVIELMSHAIIDCDL